MGIIKEFISKYKLYLIIFLFSLFCFGVIFTVNAYNKHIETIKETSYNLGVSDTKKKIIEDSSKKLEENTKEIADKRNDLDKNVSKVKEKVIKQKETIIEYKLPEYVSNDATEVTVWANETLNGTLSDIEKGTRQ